MPHRELALALLLVAAPVACRRQPARDPACDALLACCAAAGSPPACATAREIRDPAACRALATDVRVGLERAQRPVPASCALTGTAPFARYADPAGRFTLAPPAGYRRVPAPPGTLVAWEAPGGVHAHVVLDPQRAPSLAAYGEAAARGLRERGWHVAVAELVWRGALPAYHLFAVRAGGGAALDQHLVPIDGQVAVLAASAPRNDAAAAAGRALFEAFEPRAARDQ